MMNKSSADNNQWPAPALNAQVKPSIVIRLIRMAVLAILCWTVSPDVAAAQRAYDGDWSVTIVTERGNCDRAYRYGISIRNGDVYYNGGIASFSGRVAANGNVSVRVTTGAASAVGSGRLGRNTGKGRWSGEAAGSRCDGYWIAERRS